MNVPVTDRFRVRDASELYGLDRWSNGYFSISKAGNLRVNATEGGPTIDVHDVTRRLVGQGLKTPLLLRFPQLLEGQVNRLTDCFNNAIREYDYASRYLPLFPIKVNQARRVVENLVRAGRDRGLGLEVGSRSELMAAAALPMSPDSVIVCNGFKDAEYLASAALAARTGKRVVVVVEKPFELDPILERAAAGRLVPFIGFRLRLQARGSGLWEKSGGHASKFGLTTDQLLRSLERLAEAGLRDRVCLLHFHIGSQVTEIRKIKTAVLEASRIYTSVRKLGVDIRYLDVGGGLGVDYDGSKTSSDASVNYAVQEYANDVVFGISEVCEREKVQPPIILSESGRWLVAYHSILVTDVRGTISGFNPEMPSLEGDEAQVIQDMDEISRTLTVKNYREFYHDALEYRDQMYALFNLGMLGLEERAKGETLFWSIASRAVRHARKAKFLAEEFAELADKLHDKYICNFSVFQSLPDHWALDQLFPVMPIHRLDERPDRRAALVDITCDSDGEVEKFVDLKEIKEALELHGLIPGEPYYLGFLLIGAYQDTMGDLHNLFGRVNEAEIVVDGAGETQITHIRNGETASDTLAAFGYTEDELVDGLRANLEVRTRGGELDAETADRLLSDYRERLGQYTYLD